MQTVRVWQGGNDGNYNCRHVLKDHTAEVISVTKTTLMEIHVLDILVLLMHGMHVLHPLP